MKHILIKTINTWSHDLLYYLPPLILNRDNRAVSYELKNKVLNVTAPYQQQKAAIQHHTLQGQHGNIWYPARTLGQR